MYILPTRDECQAIIKDSDIFYCTETEVQGYKVEMYSYMLASAKNFTTPYHYEMRGITFIQDKDGLWERFPALSKFFNINQNPGWMLDDVKDKKITNVQDKMDGSLITFVELPNGDIVAKSKMSFVSEQAIMANELIKDNLYMRRFLTWCFANSYTPIFELTSPKNQIVVLYDSTELTLLQVRDSDGRYFNAYQLNKICSEKMIPVATQYDYTLDELMKMKETEEGYEGFVVTFSDGQMAKIKLDSYLALHGVVTELREDKIIELTVDEALDDVLEICTGERRVFVENVAEITTTKFNALVNEFKMLRWKYFNEHNENRKEFALEYKDRPLFGWVMRTINTSFTEVNDTAKNAVKEYIKKQCNTLTGAKEFLK